VVGRLADADVIPQALAHLPGAVQSAEYGHGQADLRLLTGVGLESTANHEVEELLTAAELHVSADLNRVLSLHERVKAFVQRNRYAFLKSLGELVALEHPLDGDFPRQRHGVEESVLTEPFAVVAHLGAVKVDDLLELREVVGGVDLNLFRREADA